MIGYIRYLLVFLLFSINIANASQFIGAPEGECEDPICVEKAWLENTELVCPCGDHSNEELDMGHEHPKIFRDPTGFLFGPKFEGLFCGLLGPYSELCGMIFECVKDKDSPECVLRCVDIFRGEDTTPAMWHACKRVCNIFPRNNFCPTLECAETFDLTQQVDPKCCGIIDWLPKGDTQEQIGSLCSGFFGCKQAFENAGSPSGDGNNNWSQAALNADCCGMLSGLSLVPMIDQDQANNMAATCANLGECVTNIQDSLNSNGNVGKLGRACCAAIDNSVSTAGSFSNGALDAEMEQRVSKTCSGLLDAVQCTTYAYGAISNNKKEGGKVNSFSDVMSMSDYVSPQCCSATNIAYGMGLDQQSASKINQNCNDGRNTIQCLKQLKKGEKVKPSPECCRYYRNALKSLDNTDKSARALLNFGLKRCEDSIGTLACGTNMVDAYKNIGNGSSNEPEDDDEDNPLVTFNNPYKDWDEGELEGLFPELGSGNSFGVDSLGALAGDALDNAISNSADQHIQNMFQGGVQGVLDNTVGQFQDQIYNELGINQNDVATAMQYVQTASQIGQAVGGLLGEDGYLAGIKSGDVNPFDQFGMQGNQSGGFSYSGVFGNDDCSLQGGAGIGGGIIGGGDIFNPTVNTPNVEGNFGTTSGCGGVAGQGGFMGSLFASGGDISSAVGSQLGEYADLDIGGGTFGDLLQDQVTFTIDEVMDQMGLEGGLPAIPLSPPTIISGADIFTGDNPIGNLSPGEFLNFGGLVDAAGNIKNPFKKVNDYVRPAAECCNSIRSNSLVNDFFTLQKDLTESEAKGAVARMGQICGSMMSGMECINKYANVNIAKGLGQFVPDPSCCNSIMYGTESVLDLENNPKMRDFIHSCQELDVANDCIAEFNSAGQTWEPSDQCCNYAGNLKNMALANPIDLINDIDVKSITGMVKACSSGGDGIECYQKFKDAPAVWTRNDTSNGSITGSSPNNAAWWPTPYCCNAILGSVPKIAEKFGEYEEDVENNIRPLCAEAQEAGMCIAEYKKNNTPLIPSSACCNDVRSINSPVGEVTQTELAAAKLICGGNGGGGAVNVNQCITNAATNHTINEGCCAAIYGDFATSANAHDKAYAKYMCASGTSLPQCVMRFVNDSSWKPTIQCCNMISSAGSTTLQQYGLSSEGANNLNAMCGYMNPLAECAQSPNPSCCNQLREWDMLEFSPSVVKGACG